MFLLFGCDVVLCFVVGIAWYYGKRRRFEHGVDWVGREGICNRVSAADGTEQRVLDFVFSVLWWNNRQWVASIMVVVLENIEVNQGWL